jgi:hypothetical protein
MNSSPLLLRSGFWYSFIGVIISVLFIYGMSIEHDKTELSQAKLKLEERTSELSNCKKENNSKSNTINDLNKSISNLKITIAEKNELIKQKEISIIELQNELIELKNRPPQVIIKYQDKYIYRDKPEPNHPYGKGNGQLVIYTTCPDGGKTTIWIDGNDVGYLDKYQKGVVDCNSRGTIVKTVLSGKHHIMGNDQRNRNWDGYVTVYADECQIYGLTCK